MKCYAHRGASAYAPENTFAAFDLAISMHAHSIETDVQISRDGVLVLLHDDDLKRTTGVGGEVADFTANELQSMDAGSWFGDTFAGARIPLLTDTLEQYLDRIPFALEIKAPAAAIPMMDVLPDSDAIEITSFDWDALLAAKHHRPAYPFGYLTRQFDTEMIQQCVDAGLAQICPHVHSVTQSLVEEAHRAGLVVRAWGVSERAQIDHLRAAVVDGTTCNWPDWVV